MCKRCKSNLPTTTATLGWQFHNIFWEGDAHAGYFADLEICKSCVTEIQSMIVELIKSSGGTYNPNTAIRNW